MNRVILGLVLALSIFFGYGIYSNLNKKSAKSKRVSCQEKSVTFEKIISTKSINLAKDLLSSNNYQIVSNIEYSKLMDTVLIKFLNKEKADQLLIKNIEKSKYIVSDKKLIIDYYIYENDKNDTNKKNDKAKLYAGYLVFEFKLDNQSLYKIQTDYMKQDGSDIEDRMKCVIKSFTTIKGE